MDLDQSRTDDLAARTGHPGRTVIGSILEQMDLVPQKPSFIFFPGGETVSYAGLRTAALRMAGLLRGAGVCADDIVMIFLPTHPDAYSAFVGAMLLGAIPTYMPCPSPKQEPGQYWRDHAVLLARSTPRALVTDSKTASEIVASKLLDANPVRLVCVEESAEPLPEHDIVVPGPDDVALLQHSSGTTGLKKGVMLTHAAIIAQIDAYQAAIAATGDDIIASWLPVYHDMGLITSTLMPLMLGQTTIVIDPFVWSARPGLLLQAMSIYRATLTWLPNFAFEHLVRTVQTADDFLDLSCVRGFVDCSEPCRPATLERFARQFASWGVRRDQFQASYGMAETVFACTQTGPGTPPAELTVSACSLREEGRSRPAVGDEPVVALLSNGPPIPGMHVRAIRPDGTMCQEHEVGELMVWGVSLFDGYFRLPEQTAARLSSAGLRTRDIGFVADGEIYVLGRMDDVIVVHGRNFYAGEVEAAVNRVPGVRPGRAVAFGVDNPEVGSRDIVVVAESALGEEQLAALSGRIKRAVAQEVGLDLREARIVPPSWLSKTTSGKISRERNRARYLAERDRGLSPSSAAET